MIKTRFSNNFDSVRKAFLILDSDHDGLITNEDFLRIFGAETLADPNMVQDLKKLMKEKDSKKLGKINYEDFSAWVGSSIHQSEGFYFRHDSAINPQYDKNMRKNLSQEKNQNDIVKKMN